MGEDNESKGVLALVVTALSGVHTALGKSALGAINRLITGVADVPAAYLTGWKEHVEDANYERRAFRRGIADSAVSKAITNDELIERTMLRLINNHSRKQENRENIAIKTARLIADSDEKYDADADAAGIDEEWMSSFEKFAEDASSERMQDLWSRILSGEITRPGSFSRSTLRFIYELDKDTAESFEMVAKNALAGQVFGDQDNNRLWFRAIVHLQAAGIISGVGGLIQWSASTDAKGIFAIFGEKFGLVGLSEPEVSIDIDSMPFTPNGLEILKVVPNPNEESTIIELSESLRNPIGLMKKISVSGVDLGEVVYKDGKKSLKKVRNLWGTSPFSL